MAWVSETAVLSHLSSIGLLHFSMRNHSQLQSTKKPLQQMNQESWCSFWPDTLDALWFSTKSQVVAVLWPKKPINLVASKRPKTSVKQRMCQPWLLHQMKIAWWLGGHLTSFKWIPTVVYHSVYHLHEGQTDLILEKPSVIALVPRSVWNIPVAMWRVNGSVGGNIFTFYDGKLLNCFPKWNCLELRASTVPCRQFSMRTSYENCAHWTHATSYNCPHAFSLDFPKIDTHCPLSTQERLWGKWPRAKNGVSNKLSLVSWSFIIRFTKVKAGKLETVSRISVGLLCLGYPNHDFHRNLAKGVWICGQTVLFAVHRCCLGPTNQKRECRLKRSLLCGFWGWH